MIDALTAKKIQGLKPPAKQVDVWDTHVTGFGLRLSPGGKKTFQLLYRVNGMQRRLSLGQYPNLSLADARVKAQAFKAAVEKGEDPAQIKKVDRATLRFEQLGQAFLDLYVTKELKPSSQQAYAGIVNTVLIPRWKGFKANKIHRRDVRAVIREYEDAGKIGMAVSVLKVASRLFSWAVNEDYVEGSPITRFPAPGGSLSRERVLTDSELQRLLTDPPDFVFLKLFTAQRTEELRHMRWEDLDLDAGWWSIPGDVTKNKRPHRVALVPEVVARLQAMPRTRTWVFPGRRLGRPLAENSAVRIIYNYAKVLGLPNFRGHDMRRTAATTMTAAGIPRLVIKKVLNHTEKGDITGIYDRYTYANEKRAAMETWSAHLRGLNAGETVTPAPTAASKSQPAVSA